MEFQVIPVIDKVLELYRMPLTPDRFRHYLMLLHGDTSNNLSLPLGGYNPMAKEHALDQLLILKGLGAEDIAAEALAEVNTSMTNQSMDTVIRLGLNLSDDLQGGWTNRYTSGYDSKFRINALLSRNFCTPVFWTSETFTKDIIRQRVLEYAWRTVYRQTREAPVTLEEHIAQERFVATHAPAYTDPEFAEMLTAEDMFRQHKHSGDYHTIFNFLYGSKASASLEFPVRFELGDFAGYLYAAAIAKH